VPSDEGAAPASDAAAEAASEPEAAPALVEAVESAPVEDANVGEADNAAETQSKPTQD
jgi:hypothetical protein